MTGRIFILDPVCALPYGHNVVGLKYFADAVRPFFSAVVCVAARALPDILAAKYEFERGFGFYYHRQISVPPSTEAFGNISRKRRAATKAQDELLTEAIDDCEALLSKFSIGASDSLMFPCVDYYGVMGMLLAIHNLPLTAQPRVLLRFIGVMENAGTEGDIGLRTLTRQISRARKQGIDVAICAETPRYADYLAHEIGTSVDVVPYPPHKTTKQDALTDQTPSDLTFRVVCPGSARIDKGYLSLLEIFRGVQHQRPQATVSFVTQSLPLSNALNHSRYTNQLYAMPNVSLLPDSITEEQMNSLYHTAGIVLLPYDPVIYKYRGSAVFMEAIVRGIPVIALAGSAFAEQVAFYNAGIVVGSVSDFARCILDAIDKNTAVTRIAAVQACRRYVKDSSNALTAWVTQ